ncbi:MAG TPA: hypothetical protein V6D13_19785 [Halomicronema sp.]
MSYHQQKQATPSFVKIVYSQIKINGKLELVPMELYTDGTVKRSA